MNIISENVIAYNTMDEHSFSHMLDKILKIALFNKCTKVILVQKYRHDSDYLVKETIDNAQRMIHFFDMLGKPKLVEYYIMCDYKILGVHGDHGILDRLVTEEE